MKIVKGNYTFTGAGLRAAIAGLQDVLTNGPRDPTFGVCMALNDVLVDPDDLGFCGYRIVDAFAEGWPFAELNSKGEREAYFVPRDGRYKLWDGPNLSMRQSLIRYLIAQIEAVL